MTETTDGVVWDIVSIVMLKNGRPRGDGDTISAYRKRIDLLGDKLFWIADVDPAPIRLAWVDTPERGEEGYAQADKDLDDWILRAPGQLRVVCYGSAGWDRELGDVIDGEGNSASQYLMREKNWPMYEAR